MKTIPYLFFGALLLLTGSFSLNAQVNWIPDGNFEYVQADGSIIMIIGMEQQREEQLQQIMLF